MGMHRLTVQVAAPPDAVFQLWTDLDRMQEWVGGVTNVTDVTGPVGRAGTRYTVWFGRMASRSEVLEADPPRFIRTRFRSRLLGGETTATFEPEGDGTRLVQEFRTEGLVAAFAGWIFSRGSYRGSFQGELNDFARLAATEAASAAR
jgi:uncharacterized protein YndB with AHSA1/START domain